MIIPETRRAH